MAVFRPHFVWEGEGMGSASENGVPRMSAALKRNKRCRQSAARVLWEDPCVLEEAQKMEPSRNARKYGKRCAEHWAQSKAQGTVWLCTVSKACIGEPGWQNKWTRKCCAFGRKLWAGCKSLHSSGRQHQTKLRRCGKCESVWGFSRLCKVCKQCLKVSWW